MDMLRQNLDATEAIASPSRPPASPPPEHKQARIMLIKKIALPVIILLAGIGIVALISLLEQPAEKKENLVTTLGVETLTIESTEVTFSITSQGSIAPRTETTLVTEVSGVVLNVSPKFEVGGFFKAGEVLLTLDVSDYEAAVKQAEANLLGKKAQLTQEVAQAEQAEKEWGLTGRAKQEAPILALRQPFLEKAKAEVQFAEAELERARRKLDRTQIRAPYDGLIKTKRIGLGQYVTVGTILAEIFAVDYAEVRLPLSNDDVAFLNLPSPSDRIDIKSASDVNGPRARIAASIGGKTYHWPAKIVRTEGVIDSRSRMHYAIAQITDPYNLRNNSAASQSTPALSIGSFVKAIIQGVSVKEVFAIPRKAFRDHNTVMIMDSDGRLRLRETTVVRSDNDYVYVSSGVMPGEQVILTAIAAPVEGMQVRKIGNDAGRKGGLV